MQMIDVDTPKLLRSLAKLIEKPEIKALEFSLIKTLEELIVADSILLYEIRTLKQISSDEAETYLLPVGYEDLEESDSPPILLNQQPQFAECFHTKNLTIEPFGDVTHPMFR